MFPLLCSTSSWNTLRIMIIIVNAVECIFTEPCTGMWGQSENSVYSLHIAYPTQLISKHKLTFFVSYLSVKELFFLLSCIKHEQTLWDFMVILFFWHFFFLKRPTCNLNHGVAFLAADIMVFVLRELRTYRTGQLLASKKYHVSTKVFGSINSHSLKLIW
jgi:hypothetical protein